VTLVVAGLTLIVGLALGSGAAEVGGAASARARAQTAADAAALAAGAESSPSGEGRPSEAAANYAERNGARLVKCFCEVGATAMQVIVSVDGVLAEARAVFDPSLLAPAKVSPADGLHPDLASAVDTLVRASAGRVWIVSGLRSSERQAPLWAEAIHEHGSPEVADDWVARPGTSMHEKGLAVDLGGDLEHAVALVEQLGLPLHRPLAHEPWHFELSGSR
jgi:hypothetical protein